MNSLVIPAYNEALRIESTINALLKLKGFELIFVVDGDDGTWDLVKKYADSYDNVRLFKPKRKKGKWAAILLGLSMAVGERAGFIDADLPVSLSDVKKGFMLAKKADMVIASRALTASRVKREFMRGVSGRLFNLFVKLFYGLPFGDTQCGFKIFNRRVIQDIIPRLRTHAWETDVEMLFLARRKGYNILELPVTWREIPGSHLSAGAKIGMISSLLKLRFKL